MRGSERIQRRKSFTRRSQVGGVRKKRSFFEMLSSCQQLDVGSLTTAAKPLPLASLFPAMDERSPQHPSKSQPMKSASPKAAVSTSARIETSIRCRKTQECLRECFVAFLSESASIQVTRGSCYALRLPQSVARICEQFADFIYEVPQCSTHLSHLVSLSSDTPYGVDSAIDHLIAAQSSAKPHLDSTQKRRFGNGSVVENKLHELITAIDAEEEEGDDVRGDCEPYSDDFANFVMGFLNELCAKGVVELTSYGDCVDIRNIDSAIVTSFDKYAFGQCFLSELFLFEQYKMECHLESQLEEEMAWISSLDELERERDRLREWDEWAPPVWKHARTEPLLMTSTAFAKQRQFPRTRVVAVGDDRDDARHQSHGGSGDRDQVHRGSGQRRGHDESDERQGGERMKEELASGSAVMSESVDAMGEEMLSALLKQTLTHRSVVDRGLDRMTQYALSLLRRPTLREELNRDVNSQMERAAVREFCPQNTRHDCDEYWSKRMAEKKDVDVDTDASGHQSHVGCDKLHLNRIVRKHSQPALGDCSYLDGCRHMKTCRFLHYKVDDEELYRKRLIDHRRALLKTKRVDAIVDATSRLLSMPTASLSLDALLGSKRRKDKEQKKSEIVKREITQANLRCGVLSEVRSLRGLESMESSVDFDPSLYFGLIPKVPSARLHRFDAQWINCDVRHLDLGILGSNYGVIMADPPWDIHMQLDYGTLRDDEMLDLKIQHLSQATGGLLFLWVTGRVMETARKCMKRWGYHCVEELIWIKTNQLQRIIRTGRTGHWLNHSKEHCLVGVRGSRQGFSLRLDADAIVAEVRETSRKPDEIYDMLERLSPGTPKIEIFGRQHNTREGWMTLGNQLDGTRILDPDILRRFKAKHPTVPVIDK